MLDFPMEWRFESPGPTPSAIVDEFSTLIGKMSVVEPKRVFEDFKKLFASAAGRPYYASSGIGWAESDLNEYMRDAAGNAPLFIEAFYGGCEAQRAAGRPVPDVGYINRILSTYNSGYEIRPPHLIRVDGGNTPIVHQEPPQSLDRQVRKMIEASLQRSEQQLVQGNNRLAVQEVLWLLETVTTAFQGINTAAGTVQGDYFNKIMADLKSRSKGTTLALAIEWCVKLHGYLSSPTGGGIRHGSHVLRAELDIDQHEARLFCNLIRSYIFFFIAEHARLTGSQTVLDGP